MAVCVFAVALTASTANAATRIGSDCPVEGGVANTIAFQLGTPADVYRVPSDGVIVAWGTNSTFTAYPSSLVVATPTAPNNYRIDAFESQTVSAFTVNRFAVRIPVKQGQVIGNYNYRFTCTGSGGAITETSDNDGISLGETKSTVPQATPNVKLAIYADIEADADRDGYGDETQDGCPQRADVHAPCPAPTLGAALIGPSKYSGAPKSISAWVTTDFATTVVATGSAKIATGHGKSKTVAFSSKNLATLPGVLTKTTLALPQTLRKAIGKLSKRKSTKLVVTLTADGIAADTSKSFTIKLRGTKR